jgi:hypothetical protein
MHPCAGPWIVFGLLDDVRTDRITLHIPNRGPQVLFVNRARERASLPQATEETVFPVKVRGINPWDRFEKFATASRGFREWRRYGRGLSSDSRRTLADEIYGSFSQQFPDGRSRHETHQTDGFHAA